MAMNLKLSTVTRRAFLKLSALTGGSLAISGCTPGALDVESESTDVNASEPTIAVEEGVEVIPTSGSNNCGGRCVIKAHVKDDVIIRLSTDEGSEDEGSTTLARACVRGRSYRKTFFHPDRLKYPMKRVGKRGEGKFERITWEEAIETIASETKRVKEQYGPASRYVHYATGVSAAIRGNTLANRLLALDGGYLGYYNTYSTAQTSNATPYTYGTGSTGNTPDDYVNSKLIILWGHNPAETIFGTSMYPLRKAKEAGVKIIAVDPRYSDTAIGMADEWIPVLPGTDNAMMDAMAYVMITEDLHDQEFLDKYAIGFDAEHMPEGIDGKESYKSYILGEKDGIEKTPEWAEKITKVPAKTIKKLAREYATTKPAALIQGWGPQRSAYGEQIVRGATILATMTGNVGISGGCASGAGYASRISIPGVPVPKNPFEGSIPVFLWTDAIVRGSEMTAKDGVRGVDKLPSNIKLIFNLAGNALINQHSDCNKTAEILADESLVEFIVVSDIFMTPSAKFADILLPGDTVFERNNITKPWGYGDFALYANKVVEPPFECKFEYEWLKEVAAKLGIRDEFTDGNETNEDWTRWVVEETRKKHFDFPTFEEFKKSGMHRFKFDEPLIAFKKQIEDPENNPFHTPSGKIEIFSKRLWDMNAPEEIPAIPKYISSWEGPEDPLKEKYPLQCIGHHTKRRCHSTHDNNPWGEEVEQQTVWMNPIDADVRGIKDGVLVKAFNDRGTVEIPAKVTNKVMPGVTSISQGAWWTPNKRGVDTRGCINTLTTHKPSPLAKGNPQHTNLIQVEKA